MLQFCLGKPCYFLGKVRPLLWEINYIFLDLDTKEKINLEHHLNSKHLTLRELDVLKCLLKRYSAKEIGLELKISHRTVESYINILKIKLHCNSKQVF